jgi:hypothetical protein
MVETLESETFSILPYDLFPERKEAKKKPIQARSRQSPCCEDAQMLTMKYDEHLPFEVKDSIFSEATFNNDIYTFISETHKYVSVECSDAIRNASLEMSDKPMIRPPLLDSHAVCKEPINPVLRSRIMHQGYLDGVQKPPLKDDEGDLKVAATSIFSTQCQHTMNFNDVDTTRLIHDDVEALTSSKSENHKYTTVSIRPEESFERSDGQRTRSLFESSSNNSRYTQEPQMSNFKNNDCNPTMGAALSKPLQSFAPSSFNKVDSQSYQHGTLEYLKQSTFATAHELNIPIQSEDAMINYNEKIPISFDSIKNMPNNHREFQKSDTSNSEKRPMMGLASSIVSEPYHNAMLDEFTSKSHNRSQSSGSLDSSHIDIFNNMHLEELDSQRTASSLGSHDNSD